MPQGLITLAYIGASILFILSIGGLSRQETAKRGNLLGMSGMGIALLATLLSPEVSGHVLLVILLAGGGIVGYQMATRVEMTQMPELVAILNSFGGLAAVFVGFASYLETGSADAGSATHAFEVFLGVLIGMYTFTGSVVAFGKLRGKIGSKPVMFPLRHQMNLAAFVVCFVIAFGIMGSEPGSAWFALLLVTLIAGALGVHMVMAIGGADMPVVVSMLNSYSGWAASMAGFMLGNNLLIITGALVGSSGAILSYIMCRGMNRSFVSVIAGGWGVEEGTILATTEEQGEATPVVAEEVAELLRNARSVVIVPGYGMAVAQAQHVVQEITQFLRERGADVRFAIHPVAGRLPGHMNVLLAEAHVPYDIVQEMEEINPLLPETDVALVIGANDIVNPGAQDNPASSIYGMPVIEVWKAHTVVALKRSLATGYSGVENPLYFRENTRMLFGDARKSLTEVAAQLR
jgi:NAD(P) transhydrogenase subunit beta